MGQTSQEVVDGLLRKGPAERMAVQDHPWGDTLRKWVEEEDYPKNDKGEPKSPVDVFAFDLVGVGGWFDLMPLRGHEEVLEESDEWIVKRNGAGAALKNWKHKSGTPEHIDFRMTSRKVWERDYRPHLLEVDRERVNVDGTREELERRKAQGLWTHYGHLFIWEMMRCSMGNVCMFESLILDPDWIHDYNRVYTDLYKKLYRILIEEAGKPDGIWIFEDLGYRNGLFCSPGVLDDLIFPYYREMVDFFHGYDLPVVLHTCGGIAEAVPLIADAGFDALNPMEAKAGCDPLAFAREYGDRLAFIGGLDARILESGDRDSIRDAVVQLVEGMKKEGARYVFGSDHSISTNVRMADFRYAIDVFREHQYY
ncbi:uroporphyrinogen decarboxylase family protein [Verrucomicrobiota bacterium]